MTVLVTFCRWSVKCCEQPGLCVSDCCLSEDSVGDFGEEIHHSAGSESFFVGLFSHFDEPTFMEVYEITI